MCTKWVLLKSYIYTETGDCVFRQQQFRATHSPCRRCGCYLGVRALATDPVGCSSRLRSFAARRPTTRLPSPKESRSTCCARRWAGQVRDAALGPRASGSWPRCVVPVAILPGQAFGERLRAFLSTTRFAQSEAS